MTAASTRSGPTVWVLLRDLSRTGVPVVLARLLHALGPQAPAVHVIARRGGPLQRVIAARASSVTIVEPGSPRSGPLAAVSALRVAGRPREAEHVLETLWRLRTLRVPRPDVVVVHGAGGWPLLRLVGSVPRLIWLHELELGLDRAIPRPDQSEAFAGSDRVLAVSAPVADLAIARGARPDAVSILPGLVDPARVASPAGADAADAAAVMGAGTPGWRKGTDRLAALAFEMERRGWHRSVAWVGGRPSGAAVARVGARDPVRWHGSLEDPWTVLAGASVVVVPSREDPLPLVALEAGLHGLPVVAMPTGGLPELLAGGRGMVGPAQDLRWFVDATCELLNDRELREHLGRELHAWVMEHHDAAVVAGSWLCHVDAVAR